MVDGIEGSGEIKEAKTGDFLMTHGLDEVVVNGQKDRLSGVGFGVGRLVCVEK